MAVRREEVRVTADVSSFVRNMGLARTAVSGFADRLDDANDRTALLVQSALALAPALVPLGAAAVPAMAGLSLQLGLAGAAAGVTALAFNGLGDAVGALNDFQLSPTAENLAKVEEKLKGLGPAGQEFALFIQGIRPEIQRLQDVAQAGLMPGAEQGIRSLLDLLPEVETIVSTIANSVGDLIAEAGDNLNDARWVEFFDYIGKTAGPVLTELGRTFGNLGEGLAQTLMAFDPLSRSFSSGFLDMSRSFADWSAGLSESAGFQEFVSYVQENGPRAAEALGAIGNALVSLVKAAAPVGEAVLPIIEGLADGVSALAESPAGPAIIATAAAVGTLGRSLALLSAVGLRGGGGGVIASAIGVDKIKSSIPTIGAVGTAFTTMGQSAANASRETVLARNSVTGFARAVAPAGLAAAGLAVATTDVADATGLANTASLALMGSLGGPLVAAAGGVVGLFLDIAAANDKLVDSMQAAKLAVGNLDFAAGAASLKTLRTEIEGTTALMQSAGEGSQLEFFDPTTWGNFGQQLKGEILLAEEALFGTTTEAKALQEQLAGVEAVGATALSSIYAEVTGKDYELLPNDELTEFATKIAPAAAAAGIDLREATSAGGDWREAASAVTEYTNQLDSASGRSQTVANALTEMRSEVESTATQADVLASALDALFGPGLDQGAATDAWVTSLRALRESLTQVEGSLTGNSAAAIAARDAMRGYVQASLDKIQADAAATGNGRQTAQTLLATRDNLIATARAAGATKGQIRELVQQMNLTPKNLETVITAPGVLGAKEQVRGLARLYNLTPKEVRTLVSQAGAEPTRAQVRALAKQYDMTPKQVMTFLEATDNASGKANAARAASDKFAADYWASLLARDSASPTIAGVQNSLNALDGKTATTYINTVYRTAQANDDLGRAHGGPVWGPGTSTSDSIPARLSDGEFVIRAAAVQKYGLGMFERLNAMRFAQGGPVRKFAKGGSATLTDAQQDARDEARDKRREQREDEREKRQEARDKAQERREKAKERYQKARDKARDRFQKALDNLRDELGKAADAYKETVGKSRDYSREVGGSFLGDPFSATLGGFNSQVAYESKTLQGVRADLKTLRDNGLSGQLYKQLAASGNASLIDQFSALGRGKINAAEDAFAKRNALAQQVGNQSAEFIYGKKIDRLSDELRDARKALDKRKAGGFTVNYNGPVKAKDSDDLARKMQRRHERARRAVRRA